ncbi:hypothetical protein NGB41_09085 [Staphylococcus equorum]|uniref:hypothetical protein n=1 Tax=Staphylococcus equorum TaxID=246432 RepID=UPI00101BC7AF|nr:hypothetical protein [Staphylococcus equorum]MEB7690479.1 hypothetical protein [Staphylococcus equorum]MEB7852544.1 hypothetical protein [Staphylococcus equorum]QQB59161.1 hypothetical protein I6I25_10010 [Staphylococcus equorum]
MKNNFLTYLFGNLVFGFTQWFIIILILKLGTQTELGTYTYAIAIIAPLILLLSFGFNTLIVTTKSFDKSSYIKARWMISILTICIYMLVVIFLTGLNKENYLLMFFIGLSKISENLFDIDYAYYIRDKKHKYVGYFKILISFIQIFLISVFYYIYQNLTIAFIIYSLAMLLINIIKNKQFIFKKQKFIIKSFKLFRIGIPLSVTLFLSSLNTNIPKYFLEFHSNIIAVGVFSSFLTIYSAGNTFFFSLYNYLLPKVVKDKLNTKFLKKLFVKIIVAWILSLTIIIAFGMKAIDSIIPVIFNKEFLSYKIEILIILLSSLFVYMSILLDLFINSHNKYKYNTYVQVLSVVIVFLGSIVLINKYEILGAAITFSIFALTVFVLKVILSIKIIKGVKYET